MILPASDSDADDVQKTDVNVDDKGEQKGDDSISKKEKSNRTFYRYYHGPKEELEQTQQKGQSTQLFDLQTLLTQRQDRLWIMV